MSPNPYKVQRAEPSSPRKQASIKSAKDWWAELIQASDSQPKQEYQESDDTFEAPYKLDFSDVSDIPGRFEALCREVEEAYNYQHPKPTEHLQSVQRELEALERRRTRNLQARQHNHFNVLDGVPGLLSPPRTRENSPSAALLLPEQQIMHLQNLNYRPVPRHFYQEGSIPEIPLQQTPQRLHFEQQAVPKQPAKLETALSKLLPQESGSSQTSRKGLFQSPRAEQNGPESAAFPSTPLPPPVTPSRFTQKHRRVSPKTIVRPSRNDSKIVKKTRRNCTSAGAGTKPN